MTEKPFSNREIKLMFEAQGKSITEVHEDVKAILTQTKLTNGRVNKLENWQSFIKGSIAILTVLVLPTIFFVIKLLIDR